MPPETLPVAIESDCRDQLGEGPTYDERTATLFHVDITSRVLHRRNVTTGQAALTHFESDVAAVMLTDRTDTLVVALAHELVLVSERDRSVLARLDTDDPNIRFNDCRVDARGRIWAGTMAKDRSPGVAALYCVAPGGRLEQILDGVTISNGLGWGPTGQRMYYVDSTTQRMDVFDFDEAAGVPSNRRTLAAIDVDDGLPDGLTVDAAGRIWICLFGGGTVRCYTPDGTLHREIALPVTNPTCPTFGGTDLATLYITSARHRLSDEQLTREPTAGALLRLDVGAVGRAVNRARLELIGR